MIALLRAQRVEGILLVTACGKELSSERFAMLTSHSPVVCLDRLPMNLEVDSVCVDDCGAAEMAIAHLIGMGPGGLRRSPAHSPCRMNRSG